MRTDPCLSTILGDQLFRLPGQSIVKAPAQYDIILGMIVQSLLWAGMLTGKAVISATKPAV
jgi:hypothetical protein